MFLKIIAYTIGAIVAVPILLWFAIRGIFTGSWKLLGFVCQRQYRELKRLCESGTDTELQAYLAAHPGAREYIVYTRHGATTSLITCLFRLPAPLAVAVRANNLAVIPVLLANGASPEVRSISDEQSPAEEAIGDPEKMRVLCMGKTWWQERSANVDALKAGIKEQNPRCIIWNVMRGARLTDIKTLTCDEFLHMPLVMKEFVCRFGINEKKHKELLTQLNTLTLKEQKHIDYREKTLQKELSEMVQLMEKTMQPLLSIDDDAMDRLMFSANLLDRTKMLELIDTLFSIDQQFALLDRFTRVSMPESNHELIEDAVDLLLCSILKKAGDKAL